MVDRDHSFSRTVSCAADLNPYWWRGNRCYLQPGILGICACNLFLLPVSASECGCKIQFCDIKKATEMQIKSKCDSGEMAISGRE